jgi:hypothetical protein
METQVIKLGTLVQWHDEERSYEGYVVGQRTLASGHVLVHVQIGQEFAAIIAVPYDRLTIIG